MQKCFLDWANSFHTEKILLGFNPVGLFHKWFSVLARLKGKQAC